MAGSIPKYWMSTVSREHVLVGVEGEFCQVCHGKKTPLARMHSGDWIIYYSPKTAMGGDVVCQKFTAIGQIADDNIYRYKMNESFVPFRRKVVYLKNIEEVSIRYLLEKLSFTKKTKNWGMQFRRGLFEIQKVDFDLIYKKMVSDSTEKN